MPSPALATLLARAWDRELALSPTWASVLGDRRFDDRWDDLSLDALDARARGDRALLADLDALDPATLDAEDRLDRDLLRRELAWEVDAHDLGWHLVAYLQHMGGLPEQARQPTGIQNAADLAAQLPMETAPQLEAWLARLHGLGRHVDQLVALGREAIRRGTVFPRFALARLVPQVEALLAPSAEASPFHAPFLRAPPAIGACDRARLAAASVAAIEATVHPGLHRLLAFLRDELLPAAPEEPGIGRWPGGEALYAHRARRMTTTDRTAEELHALGLAEVARIRGELEDAKAACGFTGPLAAFFEHLRTDPRFFFPTGDALLAAARDLTRTIEARLPRLFRTLPRAACAVEATPAALAPHATTGFYYPGSADGARPGTYLVNTYRPETRPRWELVPLTLHEAVPGHHLQVSLAAQQTALPPFRRHAAWSAYLEGWALYAEKLGEDLGLYGDPHDRAGLLTFEAWRAVRLVVDTGLHVKGWGRARSLAYLLEQTARPPLDAGNEIDRYAVLPGQALAYKAGELELVALRRRAEAALGAAFDARAFHDAVLLGGPLPLDLLARRVDAWIAGARTAHPA